MQRARVAFRIGSSLILAAFGALAQDQPPVSIPPAQQQAATVTESAPVTIENRGKPMEVPFACSADDVQWGGLSCSDDQPCPVFLELAAADAAGSRVVVSGNFHTEAVTLYSVVLASDDGGHTWTEPQQRIRGAALDRILFLDDKLGWISGEELFPIPQNPFLLVTEDGGKTWSRRPVINDAAEDRFGIVQQFSFADKDTGSLILDRGEAAVTDRYALYESLTGGQSWNFVQESDKPPKLKQAPPPSQWRVRVDAPTHSYHVEHRVGERWTGVGAFAVKVDPCK